MKLKKFKNKKILILGLGKEGFDALKFFKKKFPKQIIGVGDKQKNKKTKIKNIKYHLGENYLDSVKDYDVIVKSPGIPLHFVEKLISKKQTLTSPSDLFLNNSKGFVIGVTGTKGKSTTCSLIYNILKSQKFNVFLVGNIGKPALSYLLTDNEKNIYVYELSSFQLAGITKSPNIAIILNIFRDHLDHHQNFNEYMLAKKMITKFQTKNDFLIYNKKDMLIKKIIQKSKSEKIPFDPKKNNLELFEIIGKLFQIPKIEIKKEIISFKPLPHRVEYLGKKKGIHFYNDSSATIPEATINAFLKLGSKINTIIIGGVDKGFSFNELIKTILKSKVKNIIYFPETGITIAKEISRKSKAIKLFPAQNMKQAVLFAYQETKKDKICLLSPGASSFNMFKNCKERGNLFKKYVQKA